METVTLVCHSEIENGVRNLFYNKLNAEKMELTSQVNSYLGTFLSFDVEYHHSNIVNSMNK